MSVFGDEPTPDFSAHLGPVAELAEPTHGAECLCHWCTRPAEGGCLDRAALAALYSEVK